MKDENFAKKGYVNEEKGNNAVSIPEKFALTIKEAVSYFGIGERKMRKIVEDNLDSGFVLQNGSKYLIKRQLFEEFLNQTYAI